MEAYEEITKLGKGACGAVFLVRHKESKRLFALKQIELDESRKNRTKEAVLKEAKILAKLKHPNIVSYHDSFFGKDDTHLLIVQDYCDGGNLDEKIAAARPKKVYFEEKRIMQWFIQLTMAVQYMHSQKILHRDLKTQNVFMTKGNICKLGDFGISKMMDGTIDVASTCVGTPCYLAPEMCQDIPYTSKADIWALGCLLYEMCALRPAFDANNLISLFYKIVKADVESIPSMYSVSLMEVVKEILVKSPDERPSAQKVLNLPYVQNCLEDFIKEKQYLQQSKALQREISPRNMKGQNSALKSPHISDSTESSPVIHRKSPSKLSPQWSASREQVCSATVPSSGTDSEDDDSLSHTLRPSISAESEVYSVCEHCGQQFRMRSWLAKHVTQKHSGMNDDGMFSPPASPSKDKPKSASLVPPTESGQQSGRRGPSAVQSDTDVLVDYEDDFEDEADPSVNDSDSDEEIPEDLADGLYCENTSDVEIEEEVDGEEGEAEYADDFEEYNSDVELDEMINHAKEFHIYNLRDMDELEDETIIDDAPTELISTCKNLLQEHCKAALGPDKFDAITKPTNRLRDITEEDLRPEVVYKSGSENSETCYLISELLLSDKS